MVAGRWPDLCGPPHFQQKLAAFGNSVPQLEQNIGQLDDIIGLETSGSLSRSGHLLKGGDFHEGQEWGDVVGDRLTIRLHALQVESDRFAHIGESFVERVALTETTGQGRDADGIASFLGLRFQNDRVVPHGPS